MAEERLDFGAGRLWIAEGAIPVSALQDNGWHHGEGLDVVDYRWAAMIAMGGGIRWAQPRLPPSPLYRLEERCLLAADIRPRSPVYVQAEREWRSQDALAEVAAGLGPFDGPLKQRVLRGIFAADVDHTFVGADRIRGDGHAFEDLGRIRIDQHAVFKDAGLRFLGIGVDSVPNGGVKGETAPLLSRFESTVVSLGPAPSLRCHSCTNDPF